MIKLGDIELSSAQVLRLAKSTKVPEHRTEKQFSVVDHIVDEPGEYSLSLLLLEDGTELKEITRLYESRQPFTFETEYEVAEVVLASMELSPASANAVSVELRLREIRRAELRTRTVTFKDPASGVDIETGDDPPGGDDAQSPKESEDAKKVEQEQGESWADKLYNFLRGLF